jgi:hypothetical protein
MTTKEYMITFKPRWMDKAGMTMHMEIPDTHEKFTYEIVGYGAEPLSKGNIRLECKARKPKKHTISVTNPYKDKKVEYLVISDIPNFSGMKNPIMIDAG